MNNTQFREVAEEMLLKCTLLFSENDPPLSVDEVRKLTRIDVKRLTTIIHMVYPSIKKLKETQLPNRGLEIGTGYGALILSLARLFPEFEWSGIEHPARRYTKGKEYLELFHQFDCHLKICDLTEQQLPFADNHFSFISFSEVLEHLPMEKVLFVIKEMQRVLCRGGWIIVSSPNLVSLLNRIAILRGKAIFAPPVPLEYAGGTFGHIHLYTAEEFVALCWPFGLQMRQVQYASRYLKYKQGSVFWKKVAYKICWLAEILCWPITKKLADTWYILLQKPYQCEQVDNHKDKHI